MGLFSSSKEKKKETPTPPAVPAAPYKAQVVGNVNGMQIAYLKHGPQVYKSVNGGEWVLLPAFEDLKGGIYIGAESVLGFFENEQPEHPFCVFHVNGSITTWGDSASFGDVLKARDRKVEIVDGEEVEDDDDDDKFDVVTATVGGVIGSFIGSTLGSIASNVAKEAAQNVAKNVAKDVASGLLKSFFKF